MMACQGEMINPLAVSPTNPFSTRCVRPQVVPYRFPNDADADRLLGSLGTAGWWGQVIGPHGSGKSTLLHTLIPRVEQVGRRVVLCTLCRAQRRLGLRRSETAAWNCETQVVVDGYEQLHWFSRMWLQRVCRKRNAGLLVTAHDSVGLPTLWETPTNVALACQIVGSLLSESQVRTIATEDVRRLFHEHHGDIRELLMALYDVYEQRSAENSPNAFDVGQFAPALPLQSGRLDRP
jgi:hypothetical protein